MIEQIINYFESISPVLAAFYASLFTWILTAIGASLVFLFKGMNRGLLDGMLGFTGGVMVAASFWSLFSNDLNYVNIFMKGLLKTSCIKSLINIKLLISSYKAIPPSITQFSTFFSSLIPN